MFPVLERAGRALEEGIGAKAPGLATSSQRQVSVTMEINASTAMIGQVAPREVEALVGPRVVVNTRRREGPLCANTLLRAHVLVELRVGSCMKSLLLLLLRTDLQGRAEIEKGLIALLSEFFCSLHFFSIWFVPLC